MRERPDQANLINLNALLEELEATFHEGLLTAEENGITLYPHLYCDCTGIDCAEMSGEAESLQ